MAEYIEREASLAILRKNPTGTWRNTPVYSEDVKAAICEINGLPAADVAPVVHGEWIAIEKWASKAQYKCSVCGRRIMASLDVAKVMGKYPYCNCGAKMQEAR